MIFMHFPHVFQLEFLCIQLCLVANSFRWYLNMYVSQQNVSSTKRFLLQNVTHKTFPPQNIVSTKRFLLQNITYKTFPPQNVYWYKMPTDTKYCCYKTVPPINDSCCKTFPPQNDSCNTTFRAIPAIREQLCNFAQRNSDWKL